VTALTAAIRERGHWRIVVRPATYVPARVPYASLRQTIEKSVVHLRGWDFPHLDRQGGARHGNDWVGGETDWSYYKEVSWFSVSGQFVYLVGIHEDWVEDFKVGFAAHGLPTAGSWLGVGDTLFRCTEIFEFAARLALTDAGADRMSIEVDIRNADGRRLWVDSPHPCIDGQSVRVPRSSFGIPKRGRQGRAGGAVTRTGGRSRSGYLCPIRMAP
jgi:hypothetical protein